MNARVRLQAFALVALHLTLSACAARSGARAQAARTEESLVAAAQAGDSGLAKERLPPAVAAAERHASPNPVALADSLDRFAEVLSAESVRSPETLALVESLRHRSWSLREKALGPEDARVGESLSNLSTAYYEQGRFDLAEEYERRALATFESSLGVGSPRAARSMRELATVLFHEGRYQEASSLQDRALAILEEPGKATPQDLARALNISMELRRVQARYDEAEAAGRRGLTLARIDPMDEVLVADLLNNLAGLYKDQARYDDAEAAFREVMAFWQRDPEANAFSLAIANLNQADIFRLQGRLSEAAPLFDRALEMARRQLAETDPALATFLNRTALVNAEQERYAQAEPLYREALAHLERTSPGHPDLAQTMHDLGGLRADLGDLTEAQSLYATAIRLRETAFGAAHPEVTPSLTELARCLHRGVPARDEEALTLLDRAVSILSRTTAYPETLAEALALQAEIHRGRGHADLALSSLARSLAVVEDMRPRTGGSDATRADFLARYSVRFHLMAAWLLEAGRIADALDYAERGRARVLLDQLAIARVDLRRDIPAATREPLERAEREAKGRLAELQARLAFAETRGDIDPGERSTIQDRLSGELDAAARALQQAASALRRASPLWRDLVTSGGQPASLSEIRTTLLAPDRLLLFYLVGSDESHVVLISGDGTASHRSLTIGRAEASILGVGAGPLTGDRLDEILRGPSGGGLVSALGASRGLARIIDPGGADLPSLDRRLAALFRVLVPLDSWKAVQRASEVVIVPDGALHGLPFEALVLDISVQGRPAYWLDDGPVISYAPSATTACNLARRRTTAEAIETAALVVANPLFEPLSSASPPAARAAQRFGALPPLPGTAREAAEVNQTLADAGTEVLLLEGSRAREGSVRGALAGRRWRFLHFATHGLVEQERNELLAALALTPGPSENPSSDDDGLLQIFEVYELDARSELTVLSACDSNTGRQVIGEGVFALSRAFLAAGSRRVVASLWPVDDASTAVLMASFYRRLGAAASQDEVDVARALRDARREVRLRAAWSSPYYWAPFVATGSR